MPKVVVNLVNIENDISFLEKTIKTYSDSQKEAGFVLTTHSIEDEIEYLKQFKDKLDFAIAQNQVDILKKRASEQNKEVCDLVKENDGKIFIADKFGNIFYPPPFQYSYVELTYGNYKKFNTIRFLGETALVFTARFQIENVKHEISPTTLKLFENIHKIKEEQTKDNIFDFMRKSDEECRRALSGKPPIVKDWRYFFTNYFHAPVKFSKDLTKAPKIRNIPKFDKEKLKSKLLEIQENKENIKKFIDQERQKTSADPVKENPAKGTSQDTDVKKAKTSQCKTDDSINLLQGLDASLNNLSSNLERRIQNFQRRFDLNCLMKDLKDCLLPPDLDFCDFFFKDISIPKFYEKISLLKTAGLGDLYVQIENKLEEEFGVTELREKEKEIKQLEKLLEEEDELRSRLNQFLEEYEQKVLSLTEDMRPLTERLEIINNNLQIAELGNREGVVERLTKQKENIEKRIFDIQQQLDYLRERNRAVPSNLERLNTNYDEHLRRKGELQRDFGNKISENKFNERQAELIRQGQNLQAIFLIPNEDEKYSSEAIATTIINSIDSIIPLENLCKLLFQLAFSKRSFSEIQIPNDLWSSIVAQIKDPFFNLSTDLQKLFLELISIFILNLIDSILKALSQSFKALCDTVGNIISNSIEQKNDFDQLLQSAGSFALEQVATTSISTLNTIANGNIVPPNSTSSVDIAESISATGANIATDMVSWFQRAAKPSIFSQWDLSPDGKTFVLNSSPIFDFSQVEQFLTSGILDTIDDVENYSTRALTDMLSSPEQSVIIEQEPPESRLALNIEESKSQIGCLLSRSVSLLTPSETLNLLTKKPDQNTVNIINKLAEICAPDMLESYPGNSLANLLGEIGILAGALEVEEKIKDVQGLEDNLPITEKVLCERYDNTFAFRQSLMANAIEPELAQEILNEIENKKQEELSYVIDSISQIANGEMLEKPQTSKQFYLDAIEQIVDMQKEGKEPKSLSDLQNESNSNQKINIKKVIEDKINQESKNNSTLNTMFDLTSESLFRPYKDRFSRDSENYLNAISLELPYEKEIKKTQITNTPEGPSEVPTMEFLNTVNMGYVPALEIKEGQVTILPSKTTEFLEAEQNWKNILKSYEEDIENYQFYEQISEEEYPEPKKSALEDLEFLKSYQISTGMIVRIKAKSQTFGGLRDLLQRYYLNGALEYISEGPQKIQRYLEALYNKQVAAVNERTFITSGVIASNIEIKMLPTYILPFNRQVGSKTILTNKIFAEEKNEGITLSAIDGPILLSNGYVEDNFINEIYKIGQQSTSGFGSQVRQIDSGNANVKILDKKLEVGQKYLDSLKSFEDNLVVEIDEQNFSIYLSAKHSASVTNPLLSRPELFGLNDSLSYDTVVADKPSNESLDCAIEALKNPLDISRDIINTLTRQLPLQNQLKDAIPLWKIEYVETDNSLKSFSLKTNGLSFSPSGKYDKFYHDTESSSSEDAIDDKIKQILLQKFDKIPSRFVAFRRFLGADIPEDPIDIYGGVAKTIKNKFTYIFRQSRLLENTDQQVDSKFIEFFDFTRQQTEYEKQNNLDPNIMNFSELKSSFQSLYNLEKEDKLTSEQIKGEKSSDNRITKAAKNILLVSFIRLCVNEYILKNIFILDILSFTKNISEFNFIVKDISNFICQEAKRVQIVNELQKQSIKYYDLMVENREFEKKQSIDSQLNLWKASNSFSSTVSNPKMIELVKIELKKCLNKFSSLLQCQERESDTDYFIDKLLTLFEEEKQASTQLGFETPGTNIYIKKYVKMPGLTSKGIQNTSTEINQKIRDIKEKEITIDEFISLSRSIKDLLLESYDCESSENVFQAPVIFGAKLVIESRGEQDYYIYDISREEVGVDSSNFTSRENINEAYNDVYEKQIYPAITNNDDIQVFFKYCFGFGEMLQIFLSHCFLYHNDQDARFLFEGTKVMISRMYMMNLEAGSAKSIVDGIDRMLEEQKRNEENTGNPLGPALEAAKFFYRTPIQILKGIASITDPNIALADLIVKGAAMAGNLSGQKINIPYSVASLALLPFPLFNGVAPPIPPLTSYNVALPVGPVFLGLEPLLWDLPYYQNEKKGKLTTGDGKQNPYNNPLFCELSDEENSEE